MCLERTGRLERVKSSVDGKGGLIDCPTRNGDGGIRERADGIPHPWVRTWIRGTYSRCFRVINGVSFSKRCVGMQIGKSVRETGRCEEQVLRVYAMRRNLQLSIPFGFSHQQTYGRSRHAEERTWLPGHVESRRDELLSNRSPPERAQVCPSSCTTSLPAPRCLSRWALYA